MKNNHNLIRISALLLPLAMGGLANAQTLGQVVQFDFGTTAFLSGGNVNDVTSAAGLGAGSIKTTTGATLAGVAISTNGLSFINDDSLEGAVAPFGVNAQTDWFGEGTSLIVTITGLNAALSYDLVFGAHFTANNNANTTWSVNGVSVGTTNAQSTTASYLTHTANATNGTITLTGLEAFPNGVAVLSALQLTAVTQVPEPSTALLGAFGALALLRRRR